MAKSTKIISKPTVSVTTISTVSTMRSTMMSAVSVFFTHLNGNLLWNCLGNLDRDLGAVFLRDWVTLFFWNLDWNLHFRGFYFESEKNRSRPIN